MCISSDAYVAARVVARLMDRGVSRPAAEAVGRKVAKRYGDRRNQMYLAYLAGVETGLAAPKRVRGAARPTRPESRSADYFECAEQLDLLSAQTK